ncbi:MAG: alpha-2-macroglobulin family protein [Ilumatobacter sp.]
MNTKQWTAIFAAAAMLATACTGNDDAGTGPTTTVEGARNTPEGPAAGGAGGGVVSADIVPASLGVSLSNGTASAAEPTSLAVIDGDALDPDEVGAVLDRLPEWDVPDDDVIDFNRPVDSLTPPLVGDTIEVSFPPAPDAPTVPGVNVDGPLQVLRTQPEGDVEVAPFIAITFDQPMVELATLDQLDAADVPVTIQPDITETAGIDGRWRWIGTRTLRFEVTPEPGAEANGALDRLPASTDYTVTIPAGTESVNGAVLADDVLFNFATPSVTVTGLTGVGESMGLDPVFVATFDQRVDADAVVSLIEIDAGDVNEVRLATDAEIDASLGARSVVDTSLPGRSVAFVPTATLEPDTRVAVRVGPGIESLEGPRPSTIDLTESGRTYAPLEIERGECFDRCAPFTPFQIDFNNQLDRDAFDPAWITVEPAVPGLRVDNFGSSLSIRGATAGNTTYTVTIAPDVIDAFGQTLGEEWSEEFDVGDARPRFSGPQQDFVTVDPFADVAGLSFQSINHDRLAVTAWQVDPEQFDEFREYRDSTYSETRPPDPDWPVVLDSTVETGAAQDALAETVVDLSTAFDASGGPIVLRVEPDPGLSPRDDEWWSNQPSYTWVQRTELAIDAFVTADEVLVWVTDLLTGDPVDGASITALGTDEQLTTGADGVARVTLTRGDVTGLLATSGDRSSMLPAQRFNGWESFERRIDSRWYVVDDRGVYRPGETVRMTGLVREIEASDAQLTLFGGERFVRYIASDPFGNELANDVVPVNSVGGFNLSVDVPEASNTGGAFVQLYLVSSPDATDSGFSWFHEFEVQDFRTPDFEVDARSESAGPYFVVDPATIAVDAGYFAGGPLGDAEVNWFVSTSDTTYSPPSWRDFSFGVWTPWWLSSGGFDGGFNDDVFYEDDYYFEEDFGFPGGPFGGDPRFQEFAGRTDASGTHLLQLDFADIPASSDPDAEPRQVDQPTSVTAEVTVFDVNRQAIASRTNLLVHPAQYYVGLRSDRGFVEQGDPIVIDTTVVDVDGNAIAGRTFDVTAARLDYTYDSGRYVEELVDEQACSVTSTDAVTNAVIDDAMRCEFSTDVGGQYRITAIVTDDDGRSNRAVYTQWVSGGTAIPTRGLTQGDVVIVPDAEFYAPGDTAELLVQAPFAPASGLMIVTRAGVESIEAFDAPDGSAVLQVPIADDDTPNLNVRIDMVGTSQRIADDGTALSGAPPQPAFAAARIGLQIPPIARTLDVTATPASTDLLPGDSTTVTVTVNDADGSPVADAGVALIVVDEAVLSLSGYELADPLDAFYRSVGTQLDPQLLRSSIILANPEIFDTGGVDGFSGDTGGEDVASAEVVEDAMEEESIESDGAFDADVAPAAAPQSRSTLGGDTATPIDVRSDFDALAVFAPDEVTDADGAVTVTIDLPDNLTRYRVMAIAASGAEQFGSGESNLTARLPVSVRPAAPRFLNFGDRFELPVVVQNQTDEAVPVDVVLEVANLSLEGGGVDGGADGSAGRRVMVPANDRVEVRFPISADDVGTARFRVATVSGEFADAASVALPVYTPSTSEAFATYGVLDGDAPIAQPLLAPTNVFPQFGGLEISTSSTALQALTDAVLYLYEYRYESSDGYASRIMAVAALRDVLDAFDADGLPAPDELDAAVTRDIERLQALQNGDGGFPYWQRGRVSVPWVSVNAAHALVLAQQNGYTLDQNVLDFSLGHLRDIENFIPSTYSAAARHAISAYALYVRGLAGDEDSTKALDLFRGNADTLQLDSIAQLWTVITDVDTSADIAQLVENSAVETAGAATFATSYSEDDYVIAHSDRRTDAMVLDALIRETPDSDVIPKVVAGLLGDQTRGRWGNAYENSFILLALNEYFDTFESVDPDFVARAWLGDTYAAESEFRGRSTDTLLTTVPTADLIAAGDVDLVLDKDGAGRLYYRFALRYAPDDLDLDPRDEGFVVQRTYEGVDDDSEVVRRADGTWEIAAGASVRVRVTMVADAQRTHVALIDPLPAGLEPVNPAFATSPTTPADTGGSFSGYWWWQWYQHQNLRDDRAEAFTSFLPGGTYEYSYVARATTPGEFVVPPSRAEEIYAPEVFGRSSSDRVMIIER